MRPYAFLITLALSLSLLLAACGGGGSGGGTLDGASDTGGTSSGDLPGGGSSGGTALLRILATDAPFPFDDVKSAVVLVDRIEIREVDGPFKTLTTYSPPKELDLVELRNGVVDVLFEGDPGPGTYDAVRIIVNAKEITIDDAGAEKTFTDFKVPSGPQTGIKVFIDNDMVVTSSLTQDLVLDFDLARSFVVQGNPKTPAGIKGFHFKPVIRAINTSTAGTLTFLVKSDNGTPGDTSDDFFVNGAEYEVADTSVDPEEVVASGASGTDPDDPTQDGYVFHPAVPAGTYELTVSYEDHDSDVRAVGIVAANLTDLGTITLTATAGVIEGTVTTKLTNADGDTIEYAVSGAAASATAVGDTDPSATDTTSSVGGYALSPLVPGTYDVLIELAGYEDGTAQAAPRVYGAPESPVDIVLVPLTGNVTGTVLDSTSTPIEGATITAILLDETIATATTDVNGQYTIANLPTGSYTIEGASGALSGSATLEHVGGGSDATVDLTLE